MKILIATSISPETAAFEKRGDTLIINGEAFDFSPLQEGERIPMQAINSVFFSGAVERHDGELIVPIRMPISDRLAETIGEPGPLLNAPDGPLDLPKEPAIQLVKFAPEPEQEALNHD